MKSKLHELYQGRVINPTNLDEIPKEQYMVYVLLLNEKTIVLGHGKKNRARIIFDNKQHYTKNHIKALFVRLYHLYDDGEFERFIIICENKEEAKKIEDRLHKEIGGNNRHVSENIRKELFKGLDSNSLTKLVLEIAILSSFDGIADIKNWYNHHVISEEIWKDVANRLGMEYPSIKQTPKSKSKGNHFNNL
jgi:hypothetical protein